MSAKLLTEAQAQQLIREIIVWDELYEAGYLTEAGLWDKIKGAMARGAETAKYQLGKAGSMEKGGTILGRGKASKEASAELDAIMAKAENATLKGFFDRLKEEHPEYPNQKSQEDFVGALQEIGIFFASLHAAAGKKEGEEGYLPCQIANAIIDDLKKVVQKTLDYDLSDVYKHFKENKDLEGALVDEGFMDRIKGAVKGFKDAGAPAGGQDAPEERSPARLTGKDSSTIKGLKSNLLPALLALGGAAAGMGHILVNQPWFLELVTKKAANPKVIIQTLQKTLNVKPGEGPTQMLGRLLQANPGHYAPDVPVATMLQDMQAAGIGPEAMAKLGRNPASWLKNWNQMMASPEAGSQTLGQFFGPDAIKGLAWDPTAAGAGVDIGKTVVKTIAQGGGSAAAAGAATVAAASWATGVLGIGLLASAAAVKAIRIKGLKSSRAQGLNDLMNTLNPVDCDEGPGTGEECPEGQTRNPETGECEEGKPECDPETQMVDPDTGECIDIPKCPPGTVYDPQSGKCRRVRQTAEPQRLMITMDSELAGKPNRPSVEKVIRTFGAENGYNVDDDNLDDVLSKIEQWAEWTSARAYGVNRNAKAFPAAPKPLLSVREGKSLNELSPAPEEEKQPSAETDQENFAPRSKSDVRDGKILIFVKKNGKGKVRRSLRSFLFTDIFTSQGSQTPFDRPLDRKQAKALASAIADFVYDELEQQGGEVQQQQQQEAQKRPTLQELNENKTIQRWKHLAGIKSE